MGLNYHHERAASVAIHWIYIKRIDFKFRNPGIKSAIVEKTVLDKLCNQAHLPNSGR